MNKGFRQYKLDNGLVVALQNTPTETIEGNLRVNFGAYHERKGERGIAHFLEHCLMSAGSSNYSPEESEKIRKNLGSMGARTNSAGISFPTTMLGEDIEVWLKLISDMVFNPAFDRERVYAERQRILREIADLKSKPSYAEEKKIREHLYRKHPAGIFVAGNEKDILDTDIKKLREFHNRGFYPNNMDIVLVGNIPNNIKKLVERYFGRYKQGDDTRIIFPDLKPLKNKTIQVFKAKDMYNIENPEESSATVFLCLVAPSEGNLEAYSIRTLSHLLGNGTDSRLHRNLSLEKGLAYYVDAVYDGTFNAGVFKVQAKVKATRVEEAVSLIFDEIKRCQEDFVSPEEIEYIQKYLRFSMAHQLEANKGHADVIKMKLDYNIDINDWINGFKSVTAESIREAARKYFPDSREKGKYVLSIRDPLKES